MTDWVIPCLLAGVAAAAIGRRTDVYGALTDGAAEGPVVRSYRPKPLPAR